MDLEKINAAAENYLQQQAVNKARDDYYAEQAAKEEAENNKPLTEKALEAGAYAFNVGKNMVESLPDMMNDMSTAYNKAGEARMNFLHEAANLQEAAMLGQQSGDYSALNEQINRVRQAGRDASVEMSNLLVSPVRQAARAFVRNNADNNESPFQGMAQYVQQTDVNLEYFMNDAEKIQKSREVEDALGIPAGATLSSNDAFRQALDMYNLKKQSDNIENVWEQYPELEKIASMSKEEAAIALHDVQTVKNSHSIIDTFMTYLEKGSTELEYNNLQFKIAHGRATDEEVKRAEELKKQIDEDKTKPMQGFSLEKAMADVGNSLPEMGQSIATGLEYGGAAMAAVSVAAIAVTIMTGGTDALVAAGIAGARSAIMAMLERQVVKKGLETAVLSGAGIGMMRPESGKTFTEYKAQKKADGTPLYTDQEAAFWADATAIPTSVIEVTNFKMIGKAAYPVAADAFKMSVESITKETLGRETLKDFAKGRMGDWLKIAVSESAEESAQSYVTDTVSNIARASKGKDAAHLKQYSEAEKLYRAAGAFVESLPAALVFGAAGAGAGTITGGGRMYRARKRAAEMEQRYGQKAQETMTGAMMLEQLQKAVQSGNMQKVAPDVQKKVLHEQLAGTKFAKSYIDVEMAMKQEHGREDLKKIAEAEGMSASDLEAAISVNGFIPVSTAALCQVKTSPEILETVSFSEGADSMARMKENGKKIVEEYNEKYKKMMDRQMALMDTVAETYIPHATKEQKEALQAVMFQNPTNPAQGWNVLYKEYTNALMEKIGPALSTLKQGMKLGKNLDIQDEQGNVKTINTPGENAPWYSKFYNTFNREPTKTELRDMAIALTIGDPSAPKVEGWIADSAETQQSMDAERAIIDNIRNKISTLESIKAEAKKLTGVEMEITEGLSPEGYKVYRALSGWTDKAGGKIARAGRMTALLVARNADIVAAIKSKQTGRKYTAEDQIMDTLRLQLIPKEGKIEAGLFSTRGELAEEKLKRDTKKWNILVGSYKQIGKEKWKERNSSKLYDFMDVPLALQLVGVDYNKIKTYGSIFEHSLNPETHRGMDEKVLKNLPRYMADPVMILKGSKPDSYLFVLEAKNKNDATIVAPVEISKEDERYGVINVLNSVYPKDGAYGIPVFNGIAKSIEDREVLYLNKNKADLMVEAYRRYLPTVLRLEMALSNLIVSEDYAKVKNENDLENAKKENPWMYQLAGVQAGNAPLETLERAKAMEGTPDEIYAATGWVKGKDGKWRFEIPDKLESIDFGEVDEYGEGQLDAIYDNPRLYEAYPQLMFTQVILDDEMGDVNGQTINNAVGNTWIKINANIDEQEKKKVLTHEIQHIIQHIENFAGGGSERTARWQLENRLNEITDEKEKQKMREALEKYSDSRLYYMLAGEEEARRTADRAEARDQAHKEAAEAKEKFEALKAKTSPEKLQALAEYEKAYKKIYSLEEPTEADEKHFEEVAKKLDDEDLRNAYQENEWYKDTLEMWETGKWEAPEPHSSHSLIVFNGVEYNAEQIDKNYLNPFMLFQRAWHGTPHDFNYFDLGAIGSGEGAQVHGWGLYFAQDRKTSEKFYKERLTDFGRGHTYVYLDSKGKKLPDSDFYANYLDGSKFINGETEALREQIKSYIREENKQKDFYDRMTILFNSALDTINDNPKISIAALLKSVPENEKSRFQAMVDIAKAKAKEEGRRTKISDVAEEITKTRDLWVSRAEKQQDKIDIWERLDKEDFSVKENTGTLFEVEIPDNDVLLDEQKQFSQQPEQVRKALIEIVKDNPALQGETRASKNIESIQEALEAIKSGDDAYYAISRISDYAKYKGLTRAEYLADHPEEAQKELTDLLDKYKEEADAGILAEPKKNNSSDKDIYDKIKETLNISSRATSELLNKYGIKGITYEGIRDGRCFVVFDDKAISIIEKYNQQQNFVVQGGIDQDPTQQGRWVISIMENADESTMMHEMAHLFLSNLEDLAKIDETSQKELEIVNQWAEWHKGAAAEYKGTDWYEEFALYEQTIIDAEEHGDHLTAEATKARWRHERFARGFEMYLKSGEAPAKGLRAVFRKFKEFLRALYKRFTSDGGKPSEQVRRVMDRMIATEDEIDAAALDDRYNDVTKAGGEKLFNEKEEETFKRWHAEELERAKEKVMKLVMQDLEKEKQAEFAAKMKKERENYRKQLGQEEIYLARQILADTKNKEDVKIWFDSIEEFEELDKVVPPLETAVDQHMEEYGKQLDQEMMESYLTKEAIDMAMQSSKYRAKIEEYVLRGMERKKQLINKINVKARAAMDSIEDKLNALPEDVDLQLEKYDNPTVKAIMQEINKLRFADKWTPSDINHIESMLRASTQADVKKALKEFKKKQQQAKQDEIDLESVTKGHEEFFRDLVKQTTANKPMTETCNVSYYINKEREAGRRVKAFWRAKNWDGATQQQKWKVFYSMMVREARKNKETRDKMLHDLERKASARTVRLPKNERYWFNHLLFLMRVTKADIKMPEGGVDRLEDMFKEQVDTLDMLYTPVSLLEIRDKGENYGDYNQKSLTEFSDIYEDLKRLYTIGQDKFNTKTMDGRSFEELARNIMEDETANHNIATVIRKINPDTGGLSYIDAIGDLGETGDKVAKGIQKYNTSMLKVENILDMLGEKARKYLYGTLEKAAEKEAELSEKNLKALRAICSMYTREEMQAMTDRKYDFSSEQGQKISKESVICMALNYGNEQNRQRLIGGLISDGQPKTAEAAKAVQQEVEALFEEALTAKDWDFIQKLWDHIGSFWNETAAVEETLNGVALGRVKNSPFQIRTADGKEIMVKGGYMHIKYNFDKSSRAEEQQIDDAINSMRAGAARLGAGRGMVKSRTEYNVYRPLQNDFTVIEEHLENVIHNIAFRVPLRDVYRLLHYANFKTGVNLEDHIKRTFGVEAFRVIDDWALDAWKVINDNRNSADGVVNSWLRFVRANSVMGIMGYRLWAAIENISNIGPAADKVGGIKVMQALGDFYRTPWDARENMKQVKKLSAFMRGRADNLDRDLRSQPGTFRAGNKLVELAREHAYDFLVWSDLAVSAPLWWRSFKDAIKPKVEEVQAENEENMAKRLELAAKVDEIKAQIADELKGAEAIDEHMRIRRYGKPEEIEALRGTTYSNLSDAELRAQWGQHKNNVRTIGKELFKLEMEMEQAQKLPVYDDNELLEEAKRRAVYEADKAIRDTFGSGRTIDLPAVQRSKSELVRLFTAFYGFFNTQYNALYMAYMNSKYLPSESHILRWAPFAKSVMYRVVLPSFIGSALAFAMGLQGSDKDDKEETVTGPDGKKVKVGVPAYERFLKVWGKNAIGISTGGLYGLRDIVSLASDYIMTGKNYGYKFGGVATRSITEGWRAVTLLSSKGEKDAEIQAQQEKREREHQERLKKYKGKKLQEYKKKWEEEEKYRKPPKRITYPAILGHAAKSVAGITAAKTGITSTMTNAVTSTMDYLLDKDMRYDPTFKNIIWSALFDKKPVEREIPKKPPAEPKKNKKKKKEKN